MTYVGAVPTTGDFKKLDAITASATATYNLRQGGVAVYPQSSSHCLVVLNGILQTGGSSFNIVNDTIVFAEALTSSDVINQILVLGNVNDIGVPSSDTVDESKLKVSNSPTNGYMLTAQSAAAGGLTWAAQPSGFDVSSITGATALTTQPASDDEIVLSDAGTLKRLDIKHIQSTPAFAATRSGSLATSHNTYTKVQCDVETFDSDGTYDHSSNYRFTPAVAGKYFIYGMVAQGSGTGANNMERQYTAIYKNGSKVVQSVHDGRNTGFGDTFSGTCTIILDLDGDDYVELFTKPLDSGGANCNYYTDSTCFGGFRISGVA